jgi:hypothetical protein
MGMAVPQQIYEQGRNEQHYYPTHLQTAFGL